jgi:hypothetical protein
VSFLRRILVDTAAVADPLLQKRKHKAAASHARLPPLCLTNRDSCDGKRAIVIESTGHWIAKLHKIGHQKLALVLLP